MPPRDLTRLAPAPNVGSVVEMTGLAWLVVTALVTAGPPALPPLPGERPPEPAPTAPTQPAPAKPAPASPAAPAPGPIAKPSQPKPVSPAAPAPSASATPPPPTTPPPPSPGPGAPELVEPPQPSTSTGPPPGDPKPGGKPGAAPTRELESPDGALGPDEDDERPALPRLPPPPRPRYRGTGLFIGAGVTFAVALAEQIVAHVLVKRQCIDPIAANAMMENDPIVIDPDDPPDPDDLPGNPTDELGEIVTQCAPGVVPALALRVHSDLGLLAMIGMSAAGGALRARQRAWDGVFKGTPHADFVGLRAAGIGLLAGGVVTWFSTSAASWGWLTSCETGRCATRARLMNFTTRDASALMVAAGAGMLAFSETHRRASTQFERDRIFSLGVARLPGGLMLGLHGRL